MDAIGVVAFANDTPLQNRYTESETRITNVTSVTNNVVTLEQAAEHSLASPYYLGAIVSQDRETIYWVNETRPLP